MDFSSFINENIYNLCNWALHKLFIDFRKGYDAVRSDVLYNILIEFGILMKQIR